MVVMPADHVIETDEQFRAAVEYAAELIEERSDRIVTFGIRPTYPAETFNDKPPFDELALQEVKFFGRVSPSS